MLPVILIHGYSAEGRNTSVQDIYGDLPADLAARLGDDAVVEVDLSRWISLEDGIGLDDVSFALERAVNSNNYKHLLSDGFHAVVHSTGALVIKNWLKLFSARPSPLANLVHLAGANFGSGLAHIGQGQLARWGRLIFEGTGRGTRVLSELEIGAGKTLDLHTHFLAPGESLYDDYQVQEFCLIGSQTRAALRIVPIRYVKEDSSDSTVRTSAGNLNFNYLRVVPKPEAYGLSARQVGRLQDQRFDDQALSQDLYHFDMSGLAARRREIPFALLYETSHSGDDLGILHGERTRRTVLPPLTSALSTPYDAEAYVRVAESFAAITARTQERIAGRRWRITDWNPREQYEAHAQVVFRLRDQFGVDVDNFDIMIRSRGGAATNRLEDMIEHRHINSRNPGTITFYLRTQKFDDDSETWQDLLTDCRGANIEITGEEPDSDEITLVPLTVGLKSSQLPQILQNFRTTIIDVTLVRLPSRRVFAISRAG